jgi:tRNA-2-methylthio-N6-dimethylallyladenosine synthase
MSRTYHITTFGCQMNAYDSETMEGIMAARGWSRAVDEASADVILYNTCVVRDHAESRALARLDQLRALKRRRPSTILGVTGCMAQKEAEALFERLPHLDLILGTRAIPRLGALLDRVESTGERQTCVDILDDAFVTDAVPVRQRPLKALINIILGCNKNCSYCIVPRTRGREVSRPPEDIVREAAHLADHGWREITLVGQNVNSYRGVDADGRPVDFGGLLRLVDRVHPSVRIRYITSHPRDCNESHIAAVADCENVCENFHLPVQSGSTGVLRRMYRGYSRERYLRLVDRVRAAVPDATLTTDLIVGFPGETDAEFRETLSLVEEIRFDSAYMYMYSPRPGTTSADKFAADELPLELKKQRLAELIRVQERISLEENLARVGSVEEVLVEDLAPRTPGDLLARTRGDRMVVLPGPDSWIGGLMNVEIVDANGHTLRARPSDRAARRPAVQAFA